MATQPEHPTAWPLLRLLDVLVSVAQVLSSQEEVPTDERATVRRVTDRLTGLATDRPTRVRDVPGSDGDVA